MSMSLLSWVWTNLNELEPAELILMMTIADQSDGDGHAWVRMSFLADRAKQPVENIAHMLVSLNERGYIKAEKLPIEDAISTQILDIPPERPNGKGSSWRSLSHLKADLATRDNGWHCHYCNCELLPIAIARSSVDDLRPTAVIDHLMPRSRGGSDELRNLVLACTSCNSRKGAKTYEEYMNWLDLQGGVTNE
jgi:hypothetical protein